MAKVQIAIRLDQEIIDIIDGLAREQDCTRTDLIDSWVKRGIDDEKAFMDDSKLPALHAMIQKLYEAGIAAPLYKLMGMEVDKRRIEISKRLRAGRRTKPDVRNVGEAGA